MRAKRKAFSLIEVVIAIGLFAFCIIGIVGLLPIAANSAKSVSQECNANNIAESLAGIWAVVPGTNTNIINASFPLTNFYIGASNSASNYFDDMGRQTTSNNAALRLDYSATNNALYSNAFNVTLSFYWPPHAATNSPSVTKRTFQYLFNK